MVICFSCRKIGKAADFDNLDDVLAGGKNGKKKKKKGKGLFHDTMKRSYVNDPSSIMIQVTFVMDKFLVGRLLFIG